MTRDAEKLNSHAGLEEGTLNLITFKSEEELKGVLEAIGLKVSKENNIITTEGEVISCSSCENQVQISDVGHILPGSHYVYCKDPICIMDYLERFG